MSDGVRWVSTAGWQGNRQLSTDVSRGTYEAYLWPAPPGVAQALEAARRAALEHARQLAAIQRAVARTAKYAEAHGRAMVYITNAVLPWRPRALAALALGRAHTRAPRWGREVVHSQVLGGAHVPPRAVAWRGHVGWVRRGTRRPLRARKGSALLRRARRHRR